ncbi:MAG: TIGR04283 family arsenosugar biosynthesis glycosyltransferase [Oleiphilaceae bacterium]|nr:TIGR04283 family arsenosugar biosynthesis glycosyltransferase [Oleiphilaceae bacterium]
MNRNRPGIEAPETRQSPRISVIMPVWQEAGSIAAILAELQPWRQAGHQVIVVDGGSTDGTPERAGPLCDRLLISERGRARQMNIGAGAASGEVLLFLHADTRLPENALEELAAFGRSPRHWGRFDVRLSGRRLLFGLVAWFMNQRSRLTGIATGDQAIFARRSAFEGLRGFAPVPLMEDVELSGRLRLVSRPYCIHARAVTDSRRWESRGAWRTIWLMWRLRWRYWRGESPETLAMEYRSDVRKTQS